MSLPLLHAGRTNPGLSAALDLRFALDKSLTAYRGPTPSFSRASTGSYFDGSGVLRYANVNTILYSEQLENAYWFKSGLSISADSTVAPDGKTTADKVVENASSGIKYGTIAGGFSVVSGTTYTFSAYAKDSGRYFGFATNSTAFPNAIGAVFNLTNGTISNIQANTTASIQSVGNGWYRCIITGTANASATTNINFGISNDLNQIYPSYSGNGSSGYFLWGFQMETGSTVGTYCPTTSSANSAPRFNHTFNGTSWVSRGLLVEEQRTNLLVDSSNFSGWSTASTTLTLNDTTSPDGSINATKIASTGSFYPSCFKSVSVTSNTKYTASVFAKAGNRNYLSIEFRGGGTSPDVAFDILNGSVVYGSGKIEDVGNGWYRCSFSKDSIDTSELVIISMMSPSNPSPGDYIYIFGAQLEAGAFPTSYIPTTSASATRSADVCQITGSDFSSFWNGTEGTLACEFDRLSSVTSSFSSGFPHAVSLVDSGNLVRQGFYGGHSGASPTGEIFLYNGSGRITAGALVSGTSPIKISGAYKASDFAGSLNGATAVTSSSGSIDPVVQMNIGAWASSQYMLNGHIARLRYFNKRLPNATLQQLSEPDPTLNLQFALNKSLTPVAGPAPSFSRASTGTFFNASGVLTSASINTPRFDHVYSGGQWVSRGLLIEEQRTNILNYSEDFSNAYWFKFNSPTLTANTSDTISPDGTNSATKIVSGTTSETDIYKTGLYSGSSAITFSIYAKAGTSNFFGIGLNGGGYDFTVNFDLSNGTYNQRNLNGYTGTSISMTGVGNGWYRCSLTANNLSVSTGVYLYCCANSLSTSFTTSGNSNYLFGAQLEVGSFATSYIKSNSGSSATRSADVCQITGTSFGWMWNQGEGSVVAEYDKAESATSASATLVLIGTRDSSGSTNAFYYEDFDGKEWLSNWPQNVHIDTGATSTILTPAKVSFVYKANDYAVSRNGLSVLTDTIASVPSSQAVMEIGSVNNGNYWNGHIAKLIYYPARLTNTKLQQLST